MVRLMGHQIPGGKSSGRSFGRGPLPLLSSNASSVGAVALPLPLALLLLVHEAVLLTEYKHCRPVNELLRERNSPTAYLPIIIAIFGHGDA